MKPILKGLSSLDLPDGHSLPDDPSDCWAVVTANLGVTGNDAGDDFTFYVCTPSRLERVLSEEPELWGRHLLIVETFDWTAVRRAVERLCDRVQGDTWEEIAGQLGRYLGWEFEDYRR